MTSTQDAIGLQGALRRDELVAEDGLGKPGSEQVRQTPGHLGVGLNVPTAVKARDHIVLLIGQPELGDVRAFNLILGAGRGLGEDQRFEAVPRDRALYPGTGNGPFGDLVDLEGVEQVAVVVRAVGRVCQGCSPLRVQALAAGSRMKSLVFQISIPYRVTTSYSVQAPGLPA